MRLERRIGIEVFGEDAVWYEGGSNVGVGVCQSSVNRLLGSIREKSTEKDLLTYRLAALMFILNSLATSR